MSSIYLETEVFAGQNLSGSLLQFDGPPGPTVVNVEIDYSFPPATFDISATNRSFQTNVIIKQSETRSGILYFMQERIETETPIPTRTDATGVRPDYRGQ